jgi:hypothetical protein
VCDPDLDSPVPLKTNATIYRQFQHNVRGLIATDEVFRRAGGSLSGEWSLTFIDSRPHIILSSPIVQRSNPLLRDLVADMEDAAVRLVT